MDALAEQGLDSLTDGELLRRFRDGRGQEAFAALVDRHGGMVFSVCRSVLGHSHDAEDAAQAVFLTLAQKAGALAGHATLAGWLHHVAWNTAARARQAREIRKLHEKEYSGMQTTPSPIHDDSISSEALHAALAELSEKYRLPMLLHHIEGRSEAETAAILGIGVSAASMRLSRGREKLRSRLARRGLAPSAAAVALAMGGLGPDAAPGNFAATASRAAAALLSGHSTTTAASATVAALSRGALTMLIRTKIKAAAIVVVSALFVTGAAAAAYVLVDAGQHQSTSVTLADVPKDSAAVIDAARKKLAEIRKGIEDAGKAHNTKDNDTVIDAGFGYLAENLHDPDVAKFDPLSGFTDYTVSRGDSGKMLLLLERTDQHNGLNLMIDPVHGTVEMVQFWGDKQ